MPDDLPQPIAPERERRAGRVGVAFELVFTGFFSRLFYLDNDIGHGWAVCIEDHDIRTLG